MVDFTGTNLYNLHSKKYLMRLLHIQDKKFFKQTYIAYNIFPYIDNRGKPHLIEAPSDSLKEIQSRIKIELSKIVVPYNVFSGVRGKSPIQNAKLHKNNKYVFKIDLSAFFPHIPRQAVYHFFKYDLQESSDIAEIMTNLTTVDLTLCNIQNLISVETFLLKKKIKTTNHLISGSPSSQILSYLVNHHMFDELQQYCDKNDITMSIFVDDITFSSNHKFSYNQQKHIFKLVSKYRYPISYHKVKNYDANYPKEITGTVITPHKDLKATNRLSHKVIREFEHLKKHPDNEKSLKRLRGLLIAARQNEPNRFEGIYKFISSHSVKK